MDEAVKERYEPPKLIVMGTVDEITQAFGDIDTGDLIYSLFGKEGGCKKNMTILCTGS